MFLQRFFFYFLIATFVNQFEFSKEFAFANKDPDSVEGVLAAREQVSMRIIKKFEKELKAELKKEYETSKPVDVSQKFQSLEKLFSKHPDAFFLFHARDTEAPYSWLDAVSLSHPQHDEFMRGFAVVRTSSSAGFAEGSGGLPTVYIDPIHYILHLKKLGLNIQALAEGKETVVAMMDSNGGVQAVGALATILKAFENHPRFFEISRNILNNYFIYNHSKGRLSGSSQDVLRLIEQELQNPGSFSKEDIIQATLKINPTDMTTEFPGIGGYISWAGSGLGFGISGKPIFNEEKNSRLGAANMLRILDIWDKPRWHEAAAEMIHKRIVARREKRASQKNLKPFTWKIEQKIYTPGEEIQPRSLLRFPGLNKLFYVRDRGQQKTAFGVFELLEMDHEKVYYLVVSKPGEENEFKSILNDILENSAVFKRPFVSPSGNFVLVNVVDSEAVNHFHSSELRVGRVGAFSGNGGHRVQGVVARVLENARSKIVTLSTPLGKSFDVHIVPFGARKFVRAVPTALKHAPLFASEWIKKWEAAGAPEDNDEFMGLADEFIKDIKFGNALHSPGLNHFCLIDGKWYRTANLATNYVGYSDSPKMKAIEYYTKHLPQFFGQTFTDALVRRIRIK